MISADMLLGQPGRKRRRKLPAGGTARRDPGIAPASRRRNKYYKIEKDLCLTTETFQCSNKTLYLYFC